MSVRPSSKSEISRWCSNSSLPRFGGLQPVPKRVGFAVLQPIHMWIPASAGMTREVRRMLPAGSLRVFPYHRASLDSVPQSNLGESCKGDLVIKRVAFAPGLGILGFISPER